MFKTTIQIESETSEQALLKKKALLKLASFSASELTKLAKLTEDPAMVSLFKNL